jgi:predicted enzyme related to lactoylglutathione lyase
MRSSSVAVACLLFAALASGQTGPPPTSNAIRMTKYVLGVADLDRTYVFYHALGLDLEKPGALNKPNPLSDVLLKLVDVPAGTKFRNMILKIPNAPFTLEVTEFSNMDLVPVKPRIQDPGASLLVLTVDDLNAALATAKTAGATVVTAGGSPVADSGTAGRAVTVTDPDGYYVELVQASGTASGAGKVVGAAFGSMVVQDAEKAGAFYRNRFGFTMKVNGWTSKSSAILGVPHAKMRAVDVTIPGTDLSWEFLEFKDVARKAVAPRIPDPGAPAIGLQVHEMDAAIAGVKAAGGISITQGGSVKLGSGKVGFIRDPSGILVKLTQP